MRQLKAYRDQEDRRDDPEDDFMDRSGEVRRMVFVITTLFALSLLPFASPREVLEKYFGLKQDDVPASAPDATGNQAQSSGQLPGAGTVRFPVEIRK